MPTDDRFWFLEEPRKSRAKTIITALITPRFFLWVAFIFSFVLFLGMEGFLPVFGKAAVIEETPIESGVGGGTHPENFIFFEAEGDLELEGEPEPEEFTRPRMLTFDSYTMESGDIIGRIAIMTGLSQDTLNSVNNIGNTRNIPTGKVLRIPNQDGIYYSVKAGDTLESIADQYDTTVSQIKVVNELFSAALTPGASLFIPGGEMDWITRQEINGELFIWPVSGYVSSPYGYRIAPFGGTRQLHTGLDIAASMGSPIRAAMAGRVLQVGYNDSFGNFVLISHHSGYRTFYGHMSVIRVKAGAYVNTGERIGDVGSTGLSTGPHVHFTVYKNGVTVNPRNLMR